MNLQEILKRRAEIKADIEARSDTMTMEELSAYETEIETLNAKEKEFKTRAALKQKVSGFATEHDVDVIDEKEKRTAKKNNGLEKRGNLYKQKTGEEVSIMERAALTPESTALGGVIIPKHVSNDIAEFPRNEVSSIVEAVDWIELPNGDEYTVGFEISTGEGDYTLEPTKTGEIDADKDGVYHKVSLGFDKVPIKRNKITALDYMSEEMESLPAANYAERVERNAIRSIRKKVAKEIVLGDGTGNHYVGLLCPAGANINPNTYDDVVKAQINESTISDLMIEFGGSEDIESAMYLVMNKLTLKDFLNVKGSDKKPVYTITMNGNTATINGVNVIFSSNIKPFSQVNDDEFYMVYGDLKGYKALDFGGTTVETSRDFKFDQGLIALRGKTYGGGAPAAYKAFTRVKKSTAALQTQL